jgi:oligopeptide transport system ATP-binding protein
MLEVNNLKTYFKTQDGVVKAVDGITFSLEPGETLGIVGESGSGKSVTALSVMQLNPKPPVEYPEGEILFEDQDLLRVSENRMQEIRGNDIAMIFQDPMTSLNPVFTVGNQIREAIRIHQNVSKSEAQEKTVQMLRDVGIANPERTAKEYPHQFSGGMRQRAMIAMALSCNPKVLIADEPTTALDVTIQAQILDLMIGLQEKYGTAIVMISHDLGVVAQLADKVMVMYAGRAVEQSTTDEVFYDPLMPYSWSLLRSLPRLDTAGEVRLLPIQGTPPSLIFLPKGCNFSHRCPFVKGECHQVDPALEVKKPGHTAACILSVEEIEESKHRVDEELGVEGSATA